MNAAGIGKAEIIATGFRNAVDVWSWMLPNSRGCFAGHSVFFLSLKGGMIRTTINRARTDFLPNVMLTVLERTEVWFKVDYHGTQGWLSANYVVASGDCVQDSR